MDCWQWLVLEGIWTLRGPLVNVVETLKIETRAQGLLSTMSFLTLTWAVTLGQSYCDAHKEIHLHWPDLHCSVSLLTQAHEHLSVPHFLSSLLQPWFVSRTTTTVGMAIPHFHCIVQVLFTLSFLLLILLFLYSCPDLIHIHIFRKFMKWLYACRCIRCWGYNEKEIDISSKAHTQQDRQTE